MDSEQAIQRLLEIARSKDKEEYHANYDRTVQLAEDYYTYITGVGMDGKLMQFVPRESDEMFDQRKRITKHVIKSTLKNLNDVDYKVPRCNQIIRVIGGQDQKQRKIKELETILLKFWGTKSVDKWMEIRYIELTEIDPNTWIALQWKDFDPNNEYAAPYPYEIPAKQAVDFEIINNITQYLVDRKIIKVLDSDNKEFKADQLTIYTKTEAIRLQQVPGEYKTANNEDFIAMPIQNKALGIKNNPDSMTIFKIIGINDKYYILIEIVPYNLSIVPAERVGYIRDQQTDGDTFVTSYDCVVPILEKTIKANSELDLAMCLHAFPQKVIVGKHCTEQDCLEGWVTRMDESGKNQKKVICDVCKGNGFLPATTTQDVVVIPLNEDGSNQLKIDDIVKYIYPPVDLLKFQDEYIDNLTWKCKQIKFNSDIFAKSELKFTSTATGKTIDLDNVYDTLYPLAEKYSEIWIFFVKTIGEITGTGEKLAITLKFPKDFKMKTNRELFADRKAAKDADMPPNILDEIDMDIIRNLYANEPEKIRKIEVQANLYPFSGKTKEEKAIIRAQRAARQEDLVLDANYGWVFDEIELQNPKFYEMAQEKQREILKKFIKKLMKQINEQIEKTKPFSEIEEE